MGADLSARAPAASLPIRLRLADGRELQCAVPAQRHQRLHLGLLHGASNGFVEITPGTRTPAGKLWLDRRRRFEHYLAVAGDPDRWIAKALAHVDTIEAGHWPGPGAGAHHPPREEVFVGVTARTRRLGNKQYVDQSNFLWVDVDEPEELPRLWAFLAQRPAHLVVLSGGSGGAHAYWRLARPLPATIVDPESGAIDEPIERCNQRIINHLGRYVTKNEGGQQRRAFVGADRACADRSRVMRLAGTVNHKTGRHARIAWADFALPGYDINNLVGDLPDMVHTVVRRRVRRRDAWAEGAFSDPYRAIPPSDYFWRIARIEVPRYGNVRCPHRDHDDAHPSCSVGETFWKCFGGGCDAAGTIYDLASAVLGGPTGAALRGPAFRRAKDLVRATYGDRSVPGRTS
jgi:hypothetical protein